jgi:putative intracellular protease/amidase
MTQAAQLGGRTVAILVADGVEEEHLFKCRLSLEDAGARTLVVSPSGQQVQAMRGTRAGSVVNVDLVLAQAIARVYDGLVLPGGALCADSLRGLLDAQRLVKAVHAARKPIAAISHGRRGWLRAVLSRVVVPCAKTLTTRAVCGWIATWWSIATGSPAAMGTPSISSTINC